MTFHKNKNRFVPNTLLNIRSYCTSDIIRVLLQKSWGKKLIAALLCTPEVFHDRKITSLIIQYIVTERELAETILIADPIQKLLRDGGIQELLISDPSLVFQDSELATKITQLIVDDREKIENILDTDSVRQLVLEQVRKEIISFDPSQMSEDQSIISIVFNYINNELSLFEKLLESEPNRNIFSKKVLGNIFDNDPDLRHELSLSPAVLLADHNNDFISMSRQFTMEAMQLAKHLSYDSEEINRRYTLALAHLKRKRNIDLALRRYLFPSNSRKLRLKNSSISFIDDRSALIMIREILLRQDYYFETDDPTSLIIDCGSHVGLSIYYYKQHFPDCSIYAFEPLDHARNLLELNIRNNNWKNVTVFPFALAGREERMTFYKCETDSMAASITGRRKRRGDEVSEDYVETRQLSNFIDKPVSFLKMDIEGAESQVLEECAHTLFNVSTMYIEYHEDLDPIENSLYRVLDVLEKAGFLYYVASSVSFSSYSHPPISRLGTHHSMSIWAKKNPTICKKDINLNSIFLDKSLER